MESQIECAQAQARLKSGKQYVIPNPMKTANNNALLIIDMQKGFSDSTYWGPRNNPNLEKNISRILENFRQNNLPVIHIQHLSKETLSPLNPNRPGNGAEFMDFIKPLENEKIFTKSVNSAFIGTGLEAYLKSNNLTHITLAGLTTDHCVSTTARMAANLGFTMTMVSDATAAHDRLGIDGKLYPAELVHQVSLASLNKEFVTVKSTQEICHPSI